MHKGFLRTAVILGAISVAMGAFGAHYLRDVKMVSDRAVATFETAVRYQFYHVFALLAASILYKDFRSATMLWACRLFVTGIILFSGSLFLLTYKQAAVLPGFGWVGPITPFGGLAFIAGWMLMLVSFFKKN